MYSLTYISTAVKLVPENKLFDLLTQSRSKNKLHNITGMLLYFEGNFIQVLEGNEYDVKLIFKSIETDARHKGIIVLDKGEVAQRSFEEWSMGFRSATLANVRGIPGYENVTSESFVAKLTDNESSHAKSVLLWFKDNITSRLN